MGTAITDFRPMLAKAEIPDAIDMGHFPNPVGSSDGYAMEPKHDGMRAIIEIDRDLPGGIRISSRSGLGYTDHLHPDHKKLLIASIPNRSIVDGELAAIARFVSIEGQDVPVVDFNRTMRIMGSSAAKARDKQLTGLVTFLIFDVVKWDGEELLGTSWGYKHRREILDSHEDFNINRATYGDTPPFFLNPVFPVSRATYEEFLTHKIEGCIIKRLYAPYVPGKRPSKTWIKMKAEKTFDVVVMGFTDGRGKYEGQVGAIEFGAYADGATAPTYVGRCSGMDDAERKIWSDARDAWTDSDTGKYVIEVKANELVGSGEFRTPRHPQYVILRQDKAPLECTMEQFRAEER